MSDTDPNDQPQADPKPDADKPAADAPVDHEAEAAKWKALSRKHEDQAKSNSAAAKRLQEMEDANKTEAQKAADTTAAAVKRAEEAEQRALRFEVAGEKGLTPAQAKRLVGATKEELEADADELLESFKPPEKPKPGAKPKEKLRGGTEPDTDPEEDPKKIADRITRGGW